MSFPFQSIIAANPVGRLLGVNAPVNGADGVSTGPNASPGFGDTLRQALAAADTELPTDLQGFLAPEPAVAGDGSLPLRNGASLPWPSTFDLATTATRPAATGPDDLAEGELTVPLTFGGAPVPAAAPSATFNARVATLLNRATVQTDDRAQSASPQFAAPAATASAPELQIGRTLLSAQGLDAAAESHDAPPDLKTDSDPAPAADAGTPTAATVPPAIPIAIAASVVQTDAAPQASLDAATDRPAGQVQAQGSGSKRGQTSASVLSVAGLTQATAPEEADAPGASVEPNARRPYAASSARAAPSGTAEASRQGRTTAEATDGPDVKPALVGAADPAGNNPSQAQPAPAVVAANPAQAPDATAATVTPVNSAPPPALANAPAPAHPQPGVQQAHPAVDQVAIAVTRASKAGKTEITVRLEPADLGRVDIKLDVGIDGRVTTVVSADNADTYDLLRRDSHQLERALADSGIKLDSGSLSFNLRQQDGQGTQQQARQTATPGQRPTDVAGADATTPPLTQPAAAPRRAAGLLDLFA